jgi:hypothetical protein
MAVVVLVDNFIRSLVIVESLQLYIGILFKSLDLLLLLLL